MYKRQVTTPPATLGDASTIDAIPGAGGVADLTAGQILVFRTGAIAPATGDLPTNQEWSNDNINIANFDWQRDVRIVIRDYGQQGSLNAAILSGVSVVRRGIVTWVFSARENASLALASTFNEPCCP